MRETSVHDLVREFEDHGEDIHRILSRERFDTEDRVIGHSGIEDHKGFPRLEMERYLLRATAHAQTISKELPQRE